ncbi:hypothetical protein N802_11885 [Knoellia sinensis KCTC 19936]|uniref:Uncharacterized protein n=1 Tax=Knoellia sinensis KCTC 19936 TaxID=1385520 RepID=A0A0A0JC43_9MICO|nr:hypothetical protein [Knoellia sinensis]KGN34374.1 hypothetical protein N802_11885 [Knoellia sinensis KCTC 19936]
MSMSRWGRRALLSTVGGVAALGLGVGAASAHHCFIPMYSLNGPASANWLVVSAEDGAAEIFGFAAECDAQVDAGYAALRADRLPVGIKISMKKVIGEGSNNPNRGNGKGLEDLEESPLAFEMLDVWMGAAAATPCD